jgi:hypothetical protein
MVAKHRPRGARYDEMHVDGSVGTRVFYNAGVFSFSALCAAHGDAPGREEIFIIHNGQLGRVPEATPRSLRGIALRVFDSSGKAAVLGDLFRIYATSLRERAGFNWVTIAEDVSLESNGVFDPEKMGEPYEVGIRTAVAGPVWTTVPPGLRGLPEP